MSSKSKILGMRGMQSLSNLNIKKKRFSYFGLCPSPLTEHSGNRLAHYCPLSRSESFSAHTSSPVTFKNLEQCPTLRRVGRGGRRGQAAGRTRRAAELPRWTLAAGCHHRCPTNSAADTERERSDLAAQSAPRSAGQRTHQFDTAWPKLI